MKLPQPLKKIYIYSIPSRFHSYYDFIPQIKYFQLNSAPSKIILSISGKTKDPHLEGIYIN